MDTGTVMATIKVISANNILTCHKINIPLLMLLMVFSPLAYGSVLPWPIAAIEVIAAVMAVGCLCGSCEIKPERIPGFLFIAAFALYCFIQLIIPVTIYQHATKSELLKITAYIFIFLAVARTVKTREQVLLIVITILSVGFLSSIFSLARDFGKDAPRTLINPDHFSGYLGMLIPLGLGLFLSGREAGMKYSRTEKNILLMFCISVMAAALLFTMSRGGMFSITVALIIMAIATISRKSLRKKGWIIIPVLFFILSIVTWLGATPVVEKIMSIEPEITSRYFGGRWPIWTGTIQMIKDNMIFGAGLGTFSEGFTQYQPVSIIARHYSHAHSDYMELLSDTGIAGFSLFMAGMVLLLIYLIRKYNRQRDSFVTGMSIGFIGSISSIMVHSLADFNLHIPSNAVLLTVILALFVSTLNLPELSGRHESRPMLKIKPLYIYAATIMAMAYIAMAVSPAIADYCYLKAAPKNVSPGKYVDALLKKAVFFDPWDARYHYAMGRKYYSEGSIEQAMSEYKEASGLNPSNGVYRQSLAWTYGQLAKYDEEYGPKAVNEFEDGILKNPNDPYLHSAYGFWLLGRKTEESTIKGIDEYKRAVTLKPQIIEQALIQFNETGNMEKLSEILPGTMDFDYKIFKLLVDQKGLKFSIDFAQKYLKTFECNDAINFWIADRSFYEKYPWEFTESYYAKAFSLSPQNGYYRMWHGIHLYYKGKYAESLVSLKYALQCKLGEEDRKEAQNFITKSEKCLSARIDTM